MTIGKAPCVVDGVFTGISPRYSLSISKLFVKPRVSDMSGSSKQLTLFDCAKSAAKRAKLTPEELSPEVSSSNKICEDHSGDEEGCTLI